MPDYTRGDDPVYDGYRASWSGDREHELETRIQELEEQLEDLRQDFVDYVCDGEQSPFPYCKNKLHDCDDGRGRCSGRHCHGFNPLYRTVKDD